MDLLKALMRGGPSSVNAKDRNVMIYQGEEFVMMGREGTNFLRVMRRADYVKGLGALLVIPM
jgi:hypothetical protein